MRLILLLLVLLLASCEEGLVKVQYLTGKFGRVVDEIGAPVSFGDTVIVKHAIYYHEGYINEKNSLWGINNPTLPKDTSSAGFNNEAPFKEWYERAVVISK